MNTIEKYNETMERIELEYKIPKTTYITENKVVESRVKEERYSSREVSGMDVIDLCKHWDLNFNEGNILKYLLRDKGEDISDMIKISEYAKREAEYQTKNK